MGTVISQAGSQLAFCIDRHKERAKQRPPSVLRGGKGLGGQGNAKGETLFIKGARGHLDRLIGNARVHKHP